MRRQDELGRAFAGSQLQLQIYVNRRTNELSAAILAALTPRVPVDSTIYWVSPLEAEKFMEYCDADFLRVLGLSRLAEQLSDFWPTGGPNWDGLAVIRKGESVFGYVLAEAKSYVGEMESSCAARSQASVSKIDAALIRAKHWLSVAQNIDWKTGLYQSANRLAHLYFLRELASEAVWLVNLCFVGDSHHPTSAAEWKSGLAESKRRLGLAATIPWVSDVLLPARKRDELLVPSPAVVQMLNLEL
jgi:hypothetical protein